MPVGKLRSACTCALLISAASSFVGSARADVSDPLPGVRLVRRGGNQSLAIADLCAPGVGVRVTRHGERAKTAPQWAPIAGVQVAINGDFFDASYRVWGRSRGASEDWPGDTQFRQAATSEFRGYFRFGPGKMQLTTNSAEAPPGAPEVTDIIGAHITLVHQGKSLAPFGDIITKGNRRQRTAVGYSEDHRKLYLFTSQKNIDGEEIVADFASMVAEGGAPPLWDASSVDGGGSTQMYVQGPGAVLSASRQVANHLGIHASGSGPAPLCPNKLPRGALDAAGCDFVTGWAQDEDHADAATTIRVGWGGAVDAVGITTSSHTAGEHRDDLCTAIGSCAHGYRLLSPYALHDGAAHEVHVAGVDDGGNAVAIGGPKPLQCKTAIPKGVRRWVTDPAALAAWRLSLFEGALPTTDPLVDAIVEGSNWPAKPRMIVAKGGDGKVFVVDGKWKRHIPSPRVLGDWHFDGATIETLPPDQVAAFPEGPALRARPTMVVRSSGHVYVIDDAEPGANGVGGAAGAAGTAGTSGASGENGGVGGAAGTANAAGKAGSGGRAGAAGAGSGGRDRGPDGEDTTVDFGAPADESGGACAIDPPKPRSLSTPLVATFGIALARTLRRRSSARTSPRA